jgi:hypothetical protein
MTVFQAMQRDGLVPNLVTFNTLISACDTSAHFEWALNVFNTM